MFLNIQTNFKLKTFIIVLLTPILSLGFLIGPAEAEQVNHIVISEIQISGVTADDEFIELYNPTGQEASLENWDIKRKTNTGSESNILNNIQGVIKPYGYFLIIPRANCGESKAEICYKGNIIADDEYTTNSFMANDNAILLYSDAGEIIDEVVWVEIPKSQSLERKAWRSGSCVSAQGVNELFGNGCDTGNSNDFEIRTTPNPQNNLSSIESIQENLQMPGSTPSPSPKLSPETGSTPITSVAPSQSVLPVAEAGTDKEAVIGENIDFDGSDSFDPQGKDLVLSWDFGDKTSAKGVNVFHSYGAAGEYIVILKADNGDNIGEDSLKLKIVAPEFSDKIIISEILANPTGVDKDGEWVELFNSGDTKVNLRGWMLVSSAKSGGKQYIFSGDKFIEVKSYLVIKRSESGLVLTNESGNVQLMWSADKIISDVVYGAAKEGKSYAFINKTWQWTDNSTPGKENLLVSVKEKTTSELSADISKNTDNGEILGEESEAASDTASRPVSIKKAISEPINSITVESYLNKLILEKVNNAILKAKADEVQSQDKILAVADNIALNNGKDVRNNPWFWGDIALSVLSLFLVWRYQEVRKKLKQ